MKAEIETTETYHLELGEGEAKWLASVMQNPLHGQSPEEEGSVDSTYRIRLFEALKGAKHVPKFKPADSVL